MKADLAEMKAEHARAMAGHKAKLLRGEAGQVYIFQYSGSWRSRRQTGSASSTLHFLV